MTKPRSTASPTSDRRVAAARVPGSVYLLAVVIFCLGTSEFMIAGILEPIASDLDVGIPRAGLLITGFAIGMIVGAPAMSLLTLRLPPRATMLITIIAFAGLHVMAAMAPNYSVLMASRVLSAIACGGFWAVAAVHTSRISAPEVQGRAMAGLVGGLTISNLVGVPAGTWIGTQFGWQSTFWAIAVLTSVAAVLIAVTIRPTPSGRDGKTIREILHDETATFRGSRIWLALTTTALFQASVFAAFSYFSPLLTQVAGVSEDWVPGVLAAFGIGAFIGVVIGGRLADINTFGNIVGSLAALAASLFLLWLFAGIPWLAIGLIVLVGASGFSIAGALNARVFQVATGAPTLAASVNTSAFNVGNAIGPALGAGVIAAGLGFRAPLIIAVLLALAALVVAAFAIRTERGWMAGRAASARGPQAHGPQGSRPSAPDPGAEAAAPDSAAC